MRFSAFSLLAAFALSGTAQAQSTPPAENIARFIAISDDALLSSRLIGITVQNASGLEVGKIEDVVFEGGQLVGIVLSVGHILARAEHYVAVDPSSVSINYTKGENTWRATMNTDVDQLKAAPEFRYEGKWKR